MLEQFWFFSQMNEGKTSSPKISGGVTYSREAGERSRPATITVPARRLKQVFTISAFSVSHACYLVF